MSTSLSSVFSPSISQSSTLLDISNFLESKQEDVSYKRPQVEVIVSAINTIKDRRINELNKIIEGLNIRIKKWKKGRSLCAVGMLIGGLLGFVPPASIIIRDRQFKRLDNVPELLAIIGAALFTLSILVHIFFDSKINGMESNLRIAKYDLEMMLEYNKEGFINETAQHYISKISFTALNLIHLEKYIKKPTNIKKIRSILIDRDNKKAWAQIREAMDIITQLPEACELIKKVQKKGIITISPDTKLISKTFGACWLSPSREILVNTQKNACFCTLIPSILFELHNALADEDLSNIRNAALTGKLDKETYVEMVEKIEHHNGLQTSTLLEIGVAKGIFPQSSKLIMIKNFDDNYKLQQVVGHSLHIAEQYDSMHPNRPFTPFIGTIPRLHTLSPEERENLALYLSLKASLESPHIEENLLSGNLLDAELQQLNKENPNYDETNARKKESLLRFVFEEHPRVLTLINNLCP